MTDRGLSYAIREGLYLVVDPGIGAGKLLEKLASALSSGVITAVQLWDNWQEPAEKNAIIVQLCELAKAHNVPVLANNDWKLLKAFPLDGVHFDILPQDIEHIKEEIGRELIVGVTLSNDIWVLKEARAGHLDYISFCSMFPSSSAVDCEIVHPEAVTQARQLRDLPLFLAGGIREDTIPQLPDIPFDGLAVISGIMNAEDPRTAALALHQALHKQLKKGIK